MDPTHWTTILTAASTGTLTCGTVAFPPGKLALQQRQQPAIPPQTSVSHEGEDIVTWTYTLSDVPTAPQPVVISISQQTSLAAAVTAYNAAAASLQSRQPQHKLWPHGFPDQNDYDGMERCVLFEHTTFEGTLKGTSKGESETRRNKNVVLWVQRSAAAMRADGGEGEGVCFVVRLQAGTVGELKDVADGMWGAVYEGSGGWGGGGGGG